MIELSPAAALSVALGAADEAAKSLLAAFERHRQASGPPLKAWHKAPGALVTEADIAADRVIAESIARSGVNIAVISEESVSGAQSGGDSWLVDPLCGTVPFRSGMPHWGVSIALRRGNELAAGVIAVPAAGQVLAATSGGGAELNGKCFSRSDPGLPIDEAIVGLEIDGREEWRRLLSLDTGGQPRIGWAGAVGHTNTFCSAAYPLYLVCTGGMSGVVFYRIDTVHLAAGALIAQELGAVVSDGRGRPLDWASEQMYPVVVVAWPSIHAELIGAMVGE